MTRAKKQRRVRKLGADYEALAKRVGTPGTSVLATTDAPTTIDPPDPRLAPGCVVQVYANDGRSYRYAIVRRWVPAVDCNKPDAEFTDGTCASFFWVRPDPGNRRLKP